MRQLKQYGVAFARVCLHPLESNVFDFAAPDDRSVTIIVGGFDGSKERLEREIADAWAAKEAVQRKRVEKANAKLKKAEAAAAAAGTSSIKSPLDRNEFLAKTMGETPAEVGSRPASRGGASARSGTSSPKSQRPSSRG